MKRKWKIAFLCLWFVCAYLVFTADYSKYEAMCYCLNMIRGGAIQLTPLPFWLNGASVIVGLTPFWLMLGANDKLGMFKP